MFDPAAIALSLRAAQDIELARIEDAGLNAAQPPEQLLFDGWLLRFSPGKARRARSVNAICAGRLDLMAKLETCRLHFNRWHLPLLFRITPFSQPATLDGFLQQQGFVAVDETRVMTCTLAERRLNGVRDANAARLESRNVGVGEFATTVGTLRSSAATQVHAHELRLRASPLLRSTVRRVVIMDGEPVAAGQVVVETEHAGLYDIVTAPAWRGRGIGLGISAALLADAASCGARSAYLQVDAGNVPARAVYSKLGFVDRYAYWYRQPADIVDELHH